MEEEVTVEDIISFLFEKVEAIEEQLVQLGSMLNEMYIDHNALLNAAIITGKFPRDMFLQIKRDMIREMSVSEEEEGDGE